MTIILFFQNSNGDPVYRKVAIVENFFDIIYNVHVDLEGRPGKHAGQKRTYRTVSNKIYSLQNSFKDNQHLGQYQKHSIH